MPSRRTAAFAELLSRRIGRALTRVKVRWNSCVARAVSIGRAMARFLGTSSPKIMVSAELTVRAIATATGWTSPSGRPAEVSGPSISSAMAGSARKPMARLVTVIPTCAPESWVERERNASWTPSALESPAAAARSTLPRSTVTKANSAATKTPHAAMRRSATPSRIHSVMSAARSRGWPDPRVAGRASGKVRGDFDGRPSRERRLLRALGNVARTLPAAPSRGLIADRSQFTVSIPTEASGAYPLLGISGSRDRIARRNAVLPPSGVLA